ncbi:MAG: response regulator [Acidobacteriota bacterium]|nr:response regulator [Acidobacteriota bacterium]
MSLKILHLEDNELDAELVQAYLLDGGFDAEVARVDTREDFTAEIERGGIDLILADYNLPSFDGLLALEIARAKYPDIPFIIISGALGEETAIETLKSGATDYILKHRLERLVPAARRALREAEDREARKQAERDRQQLLEREQEARRKAEEASRLKDEFLATVSHELRTPLNAILGWATMLRSGQLNEENTAQAVEIIERNARAQVQLVEDLLDVSRIISGKLRLEPEFVDFKTIVENSIEAVRPAADAKMIKIETDFESANNKVFGDASRLQQVIWNLLTNAVKFTPAGGRIRLSLRNQNNCIEFQVTDTGEGISPEFLPFVFDRFRQADGATTRIHNGLGLGLSIVKHLIEMHGGEVSAKSEGIGHGSTFSLCLPQQIIAANERKGEENGKAQFMPENNHHSEQIENPLTGLSVLAVDDDEDSREMLQLILEQNGASVVTAGSVAEALEKLQEKKADVLVSDIGMPMEDGYTLVERLRKLPAESGGAIPAVALTGFAREEDNRRALLAGFNKHVAKPIDPENLVREIAELMKELS